MTAPPLTHHEILGLIEPFTRRGRHVDLSASNRIERRLAFKPIVRDSATTGCAGASEILQLENPRPPLFRLIRVVTLASGATAKLTTEGDDPGELLARVEAVPLERQFRWVADIPIAFSYRLTPKPGDATRPMPMALTSAQTRLDRLDLAVKADTGTGYPAEIELSPRPDCALAMPEDLPEDLLAILGWDWRVLRPRGAGWTSSLRAPGKEPRRSRHIESALERTVAHLARTFAEPPRQFHDRFLRARWAVVFRRLIPLLVSVALIAGAGALTFAGIPEDSPFRFLIFNFPPVLLFMLFAMRELPRFEIPPLPRPSKAPSWFPLPDVGEGPEASVEPHLIDEERA
ncbi:hypothetical protein CCR94_23990 [Rhodoblastus sphagnicola]|uniref:Uncharacterized protein n=1 Tax=Rhodoblastus sphagnicola TaxID=333368 RepID=A0A2S6MTZ7_9HYPH|nr:hypothetical protein [Rhodoblastus sphagnicola]MBB4199775.1 hypothetical protein [Rhodoblastus sphagnicola]PPQ25835.1 hypothetical protein CCR94_23990 [Rhodoblastus sphagnicola]